ncbi:MAG TPA: hypothetical protein PLX43_02650 [Nitrobacter sp.]|uniref:hypothetical protein n=2 Tax=unclassified Nitrobacter TaxID=2620411 RepID=UPI002B71525C|nr:hypothetical protein [Nitrobacter sp.]
MRMKNLSFLIAFVAFADVALAQAPPTRATPPGATTTPSPSPNSPACVPHDTPALDGKAAGERKEPLGEKLAKSGGVLCPPEGINPEMRAPTPEGGNTPVIPPPGTPGGDSAVRPK